MERLSRAQFLAGAAALALAARLPDLALAAGENLQHFVSRPDLQPPVVTARGSTRDFVVVAPSSGPGPNGAMILDGNRAPNGLRDRTPTVRRVEARLGRRCRCTRSAARPLCDD